MATHSSSADLPLNKDPYQPPGILRLYLSNKKLVIPGFLGNFPPSSIPVNPAEEASSKHCSIGVSPPSSGISSLLQAMGAIPNFIFIFFYIS